MADKQLTVAELLARAEKENPDAARRPRRRRSLEDGGVSVAELTDSFKKVDAKPAEVKHSSVPLDAPSDQPTPKPEPAPKPERTTFTKIERTPAAEPAEPPAPAATSVRVSPAPEPEAVVKQEPAPTPAEEDTNVFPVVKDEPVVQERV